MSADGIAFLQLLIQMSSLGERNLYFNPVWALRRIINVILKIYLSHMHATFSYMEITAKPAQTSEDGGIF